VQAQRVLIGDEFVPATVTFHHGQITGIEPVEHQTEGLVLRAPDSAYVVPGIVDTHVHVNEPGRTEWEGYVSATEAAALGGAATGARVHILHLSSARALDRIKAARDEGLRITVETCPHYLCFAAETIPDAAPQFKCCPPIRDGGNREELWQALRDGIIDCIV